MTADGRGWPSARVAVIERLLPHLRQYVEVRQALVDAGALGSSAATLLENGRCGVIQLDRRGVIIAANDVARALLRTGDGLTDEDGYLRAAVAEDDEALQGLLALALGLTAAQSHVAVLLAQGHSIQGHRRGDGPPRGHDPLAHEADLPRPRHLRPE